RVPFSGPSVEVVHDHVYTTPPSPRHFCPELPIEIEAALMRQLAKAPDSRFSAAAAFVGTLRESTDGTLSVNQDQVLQPPTDIISTVGRENSTEPYQGRDPFRAFP